MQDEQTTGEEQGEKGREGDGEKIEGWMLIGRKGKRTPDACETTKR